MDKCKYCHLPMDNKQLNKDILNERMNLELLQRELNYAYDFMIKMLDELCVQCEDNNSEQGYKPECGSCVWKKTVEKVKEVMHD